MTVETLRAACERRIERAAAAMERKDEEREEEEEEEDVGVVVDEMAVVPGTQNRSVQPPPSSIPPPRRKRLPDEPMTMEEMQKMFMFSGGEVSPAKEETARAAAPKSRTPTPRSPRNPK